MNQYAIATRGLGRRYGSTWALQDCTLQIPKGHITALVGQNGAGKTTLLSLLAGMDIPTTGTIEVFGQKPHQVSSYLADIGYVAQEVPLYKNLTAQEHNAFGQHMNRQWDSKLVLNKLHALGIPTNKPVHSLSGGQRAQVGLALALAKKPKLLLLDEPVAALDPIARRDFLASLAASVAEEGLSVVMSSHILSDLERVCDHLIIIAGGHVRVSEMTETIEATHRIMSGPRTDASLVAATAHIIQNTHTDRESSFLVRVRHGQRLHTHGLEVQQPSLEEITLAYMTQQTRTKTTTKETEL